MFAYLNELDLMDHYLNVSSHLITLKLHGRFIKVISLEILSFIYSFRLWTLLKLLEVEHGEFFVVYFFIVLKLH